MLLEEFDANRQAIINPQDLHQPIEGFPKVVISCFSRVTLLASLKIMNMRSLQEPPWPILKSWSMGSLLETNRLVPLMHQLGLLPVWGL